MFGIDGGEFVVLALLALFLLGPERLPGLAKQAARALHDVRRWAQRTREDIGRELGPEFENFDLADLNPKKFVQKHLLDPLTEDDEDDESGRTWGSSALASRSPEPALAPAASAVSLEKSPALLGGGHTVELGELADLGGPVPGAVDLVGAPVGPDFTTDLFAEPLAVPARVPVTVPSWGDTESARSADRRAHFGSDVTAGPDDDGAVGSETVTDVRDLDGAGSMAELSVANDDEGAAWSMWSYVAPPFDIDAT